MIAAASPGRVRRRVPSVVWLAIGGAWLLAVAAHASGKAALLHHDHLIKGGLPLWAALGLFLLAWEAMIVAMMLPSSLPLFRLFRVTAANQDAPDAAFASLLAGYAAVWGGFGLIAFMGDAELHHVVDTTPWLAAHPFVIGGGVLALAGLMQFSAIKDRCLSECRHPGSFLMKHYRRGNSAAFALGRRHGLFCLGCCWALMLLMFAVGVAHLWWMAALTAVMIYEKAGRNGERLVPVVGVALLALSAAVFLQYPAWLPRLLTH